MSIGQHHVAGRNTLQTGAFPGQAGCARDRRSRRSPSPSQATKDEYLQDIFAGATGLEPATSGVTGREGRYDRGRPTTKGAESRIAVRVSGSSGSIRQAEPRSHAVQRRSGVFLAFRTCLLSRRASRGASRFRFVELEVVRASSTAEPSTPGSSRRAPATGSTCPPCGAAATASPPPTKPPPWSPPCPSRATALWATALYAGLRVVGGSMAVCAARSSPGRARLPQTRPGRRPA